MILIGQYDSPFVRRVAIALRLYDLPFEHRPWSTFGDADKIAPYNPLRRVPTLVLDDGEALIESTAILDYLDELVGPEKAMIAVRGPQRRLALKICALATGLGDKAVSLVYERVLRKDALKLWVERCEAQIGGVLEPVNASPVIIEDDVIVGGNCGVYEGTQVGERAVLGAGVILTRSTPLFDLVNGVIHRSSETEPLRVPDGAVVVPGSRAITKGKAGEWGLSLYTPVIVKYRDERTDRGVELEDILR